MSDQQRIAQIIVDLYSRPDLHIDTSPLDCSGCNACCALGPAPSSLHEEADSAEVWAFHRDAGAIGEKDPRDKDPFTMPLKRHNDGKRACVWTADDGILCSLHGHWAKPDACKSLDCRDQWNGTTLKEHKRLAAKLVKLDVSGSRSMGRSAVAALDARKRSMANHPNVKHQKEQV